MGAASTDSRGNSGSTLELQANARQRLDDLFVEQARLTPNSPAILHRGVTMSYEELDRLSNRIARHLRGLGVARNTLVGLCMPRSPQLIAAMLGVLKAGGGYVPLDPTYPHDRLSFMLADSGASLVLVQGKMPPALQYAGRICDLDAAWAEIQEEPDEPLPPLANAGDLAYVIYTSGSTGKPKGVVLAHSAAGLVGWLKQSFDPEDIARVAACTSICFDPSVIEIFGTLCTGGLVVLKADALEPFDHGECPTMLAAPPSVLRELARVRAIPDSVRIINVGGEAVTMSLVRELYASSRAERIYNHYGPTEATTCTTVALVDRESVGDPPIGRPIAGARVYILDPSRKAVPAGETGEIYIAGPTLALGYLGDPEATAARFSPDPFHSGERMYRTGDLGMFSSDGDLVFKGRIDDQVKLRGFRIELGEVEAALTRLTDVDQAAAVIQADGLGRERLAAYVVSDKPLSMRDVRRQLASWLPDHMLPTEIVRVDAFPLGPTGKIDRDALIKAHPLPTPPTSSAGEFTTEHEKLIAKVFAQHLGLPTIAPDDDFFELGGDSLLSIQVAAQLEEVLDQAIPPALLNHSSTPRAFAKALAAQPSESPSVLTPLHESGGGPRIFCTPDLHGRPVNYISLAPRLAPMQVVGLSPGPFLAKIIASPAMERLSRVYLDAMRSVQPTGPYVVSGFSFGATQAFSLARLIEDEGDRVLLILVDGPNPRARRPLDHTLRWAAKEVPKVIAGGGWKRTARDLHRSRPWARLLKNSNRPVEPHEVPGFITHEDRLVARSFLQAIVDYVPKPFGGASLLLRCSNPDRRFRLLDPDGWLGWRGLLTGEVQQACVEGTHMEMMREPLVGEVEDIIRTAISDFLSEEPVLDAGMRSSPG